MTQPPTSPASSWCAPATSAARRWRTHPQQEAARAEWTSSSTAPVSPTKSRAIPSTVAPASCATPLCPTTARARSAPLGSGPDPAMTARYQASGGVEHEGAPAFRRTWRAAPVLAPDPAGQRRRARPVVMAGRDFLDTLSEVIERVADDHRPGALSGGGRGWMPCVMSPCARPWLRVSACVRDRLWAMR